MGSTRLFSTVIVTAVAAAVTSGCSSGGETARKANATTTTIVGGMPDTSRPGGPSAVKQAVGPAGQQNDYPVTLRFDGGYAFIRDDNQKSLTVASIHIAEEPETSIAAHQLHMRLDVGEIDSAPPPDDVVQTIWNLDLDPYDISLAGYGATPPGVNIPSRRPFDLNDPCKPIDEESNDANNLELLPSMPDLAKQAGFDETMDLTRSKYHNRVLLTAGTMRIVKATSCFEFMAGGKSFGKHRIANGLGGIVVTFSMRDNLTLNVTDQKTGKMTPYVFKPTVNQATGQRQLAVWFGRFPPQCFSTDPDCVTPPDGRLIDFDRYFAVLRSLPKAANKVVLFNRSPVGDVCPRSQCGGMWCNAQ
jgi:hypothetical protein